MLRLFCVERRLKTVYAKKITLKYGCDNSDNPEEIDEIYLEGLSVTGWHKKEEVYNILKMGYTIKVYIDPYPNLIPEISSNYEKYVRSEPEQYKKDNLMKLTRVKN